MITNKRYTSFEWPSQFYFLLSARVKNSHFAGLERAFGVKSLEEGGEE